MKEEWDGCWFYQRLAGDERELWISNSTGAGATGAKGRPVRRRAINATEEEDGKAERGCESGGLLLLI